MKLRLFKIILYGTIGLVLGSTGVGITTWQFLAIWASILTIDLVSYFDALVKHGMLK